MKYIKFPTDSKLYFDSIQKLAKIGEKVGIEFSNNYAKFSKYLLHKLIRISNIKYLKTIAKKLRTYLGQIIKDFGNSNIIISKKTKTLLDLSKKLYVQKQCSKNKIYSLHVPEIECITKGKYKKKHKFGNKISIAVTSFGWIVAVKAFPWNPYDGHTLNQTVTQIIKIVKVVKNIFVDMGYKGHNYFGEIKVHISQWCKKGIHDEL